MQEWLAYAESGGEIRADGFAEAETPEGLIRLENKGIAVWVAYPDHGVGSNMAWFCHFSGRITVKNPDKAILAKMHQIASKLSAKVQGDEGEEYDIMVCGFRVG